MISACRSASSEHTLTCANIRIVFCSAQIELMDPLGLKIAIDHRKLDAR